MVLVRFLFFFMLFFSHRDFFFIFLSFILLLYFQKCSCHIEPLGFYQEQEQTRNGMTIFLIEISQSTFSEEGTALAAILYV